MKILILGGTGYLGSKIAAELCQRGHNVVCLKRSESFAKNLDGHSIGTGAVEYWDLARLDRYMEKYGSEISWFVNTACRYCKGNVSESEILEANLTAPLNVFMLCRKYGVRRYLTMDTGLPGEFNLYCKAKQMFAKIGNYFAEKETGEKKAFTFYNILLENFYGEDEPQDRFLHAVIQKMRRGDDILLTEGRQHRDFVYIEDVIRNLVALIEERGGQPVTMISR